MHEDKDQRRIWDFSYNKKVYHKKLFCKQVTVEKSWTSGENDLWIAWDFQITPICCMTENAVFSSSDILDVTIFSVLTESSVIHVYS